jgi:signal transduction histidine kinase
VPARVLVAFGAIALGVVAEWAAFDVADVRRWLPDVLVGWVLVGCGLIGADRRPGSRTGALLVATGLTWFIGNLAGVPMEAVAWVAGQLVYLHRGFLVHLLLAYPEGSAASRRTWVAIGGGYLAALTPIAWNDEPTTVALSAALVGYCALDHQWSIGGRRRARRQALWAAAGLGSVLAAGAVARVILPLDTVSQPSLLVYQAAICVTAVGLVAGLVTSDLERVDVTDLVIELGTERSGTLRAALSKALDDPSLDLGFWSAGTGAFVGADGRPLDLPEADSDRTITYVEHDGEVVAALVHDPAAMEDPLVRAAVATAARLAAANSRLQREVRTRVVDIEASRRRILETRDEERVLLERRLHDGAERRLLEVATLLDRGRRSATTTATAERVVSAEDQVERALQELRQLARGIHPRVLSEAGLEGALRSLVDGFPIPVDLEIETTRWPPHVEAAAYFVCAEGLTNVAKYASASRARVSVIARETHFAVVVEDDGVGGADPARGSGLRGLADRTASLGGTLRVDSAPGNGTRLAAELPLGDEVA